MKNLLGLGSMLFIVLGFFVKGGPYAAGKLLHLLLALAILIGFLSIILINLICARLTRRAIFVRENHDVCSTVEHIKQPL